MDALRLINKRVNSKIVILTRYLKKHISMSDAQHLTPHQQHDTRLTHQQLNLNLNAI
jgi:hypothetical protein